jgi:hypothetical protein
MFVLPLHHALSLAHGDVHIGEELLRRYSHGRHRIADPLCQRSLAQRLGPPDEEMPWADPGRMTKVSEHFFRNVIVILVSRKIAWSKAIFCLARVLDRDAAR